VKAAISPIACIPLALVVHSVFGGSGEDERRLMNYRNAMHGLATNELRAGVSCEKMLDVCYPTLRRTLGRFTEYVFVGIPGYAGITIVAIDDRLQRATRWSCTEANTYFNDLTPDEEALYLQLCRDYSHVPLEQCIGRYGWQRQRVRDWVP
jgi:hypothetical protein